MFEAPTVTTTPVGLLLQVPELLIVVALMELLQEELEFPHFERISRVYAVFFRKPLKVKGAEPQLSTMVLSLGALVSQYRS